MSYKVGLTPTAEKDLRHLPRPVQATALRQINTLETNVTPDGHRIKKLRGVTGSFYRLRIGDYRAVFEVEGERVIVHRIINRKDLERVITRL